jgi:transcriptional regulator with XRE-family HTH domain
VRRRSSSCGVVGRRIRIHRLVRELTQEQLAEAAGISRSFLSLLEHGARGVDVVRLLRIAGVLDVPLTEIVRRRPTRDGRADRLTNRSTRGAASFPLAGPRPVSAATRELERKR